jgi:phosphatidylserine/phosphatidylglycerophosphate/cardiolipin synthase-like enzyme
MPLKKILLFFSVLTCAVLSGVPRIGTSPFVLSLTQHSVCADNLKGQPAEETIKAVSRRGEKISTSDVLLDNAYYASLLNDLSQAHESITIIMYLFKTTDYKSGLPDHIVDMLIKKHAQGVQVSMLLNVDRENTAHGVKDSMNDTNLHTARLLEEKGIRVYLDSPHRTTHAKVIIIDKKIVYIGSHNFTQSALRYNHEVSVRIVSPAIARELTGYMEAFKHEK